MVMSLASSEALPDGNTVLDYRDRAILKFFLYSGARLSTACRLKVSDFHQEGDEATIRLHEKGDKRRTIGLHFQAAQAIAEYIEKASLASGPLFRPRLNSRSKKLGATATSPWTLWRVVEGYRLSTQSDPQSYSPPAAKPSGDLTPPCVSAAFSVRCIDCPYLEEEVAGAPVLCPAAKMAGISETEVLS
jgi:site-specific recombinase XerD